MLTADLVRARKKAGELQLVSIDKKARAEAAAAADELIGLAQAHLGATREELEEALGHVRVRPALQRVVDGLRKLLDDRCTFELTVERAPEDLRRDVFLEATRARRSLREAESFDRNTVLTTVATAHGLSVDDLERGLYADLRNAHVLQSLEPITAEQLVEAYETAQAQAVLLRAVRVTAEVRCASPAAYRALFAKLKFLRLLYTITPLEIGYRIQIDGPFSMFESVTKYGLQLALCLPAIQACQSWSLVANVRWGREREALTFRLSGEALVSASEAGRFALAPDVEAFADAFRALQSAWRVEPATAIIDMPGVGLCVPDLVFEGQGSTPRVYFEVMGYWSREAVWKRVDLIQSGAVREKLLLAVSERLRVSEEVLEGEEHGALYVYKGTMSPKSVLKRLGELAGAGGELPLGPVAASASAQNKAGAAPRAKKPS